MSVQIDGKTLDATAVSVEFNPVTAEVDEMTAARYKRVVTPFGAYRRWRISGVEPVSIAWIDSIVNHLHSKAQAGEKVTLTISHPGYEFNGDAWIMDIGMELTEKLRIYTVTLQEVM